MMLIQLSEQSVTILLQVFKCYLNGHVFLCVFIYGYVNRIHVHVFTCKWRIPFVMAVCIPTDSYNDQLR